MELRNAIKEIQTLTGRIININKCNDDLYVIFKDYCCLELSHAVITKNIIDKYYYVNDTFILSGRNEITIHFKVEKHTKLTLSWLNRRND